EALRVGDPNDTTSVDFVTADQSAQAGFNYARTAGRLTFGPNVNSQTITIPIIDNNSTDGTTTFAVSLSNPQGDPADMTSNHPMLGSPSTAIVTIIDNDATTFQFTSLSYTANDQAGVAKATVVLSRIGDPNTTYSVTYSTSDRTAVAGRDYVSTSGKLTFGPGVTSKTISVPLIHEPVGSPEKDFLITLSEPTNGAFLGTISSTLIMITNPDLSTKPINISTRGEVQSGDGVMIAGFIIQGSNSKEVAVRGLGPSLTQLGVVGALQDPTLELHDGNGSLIAFDDDFGTDPSTDQQTLSDNSLTPTDSREAAIVADLTPGHYTAVLRGKTNGIGEVEVYDLETTSSTHLVNISTRAFVGADNNSALIGGFIIDGQVSQQVLIRALGPSLDDAGVSGALADPTIDFYRGSQLIFSNDDWKSDNEAAIAATGIPPKNDKEAALLLTLDPGSYTAVIRGKNNTTGIALVEVYQMP
ncbi:MAG: Calx-beta domain-containing protein, partial [Chthoniobacterales bacterium]